MATQRDYDRLDYLWSIAEEALKKLHCPTSVWIGCEDMPYSLGWARIDGGEFGICVSNGDVGPEPKSILKVKAGIRIKASASFGSLFKRVLKTTNELDRLLNINTGRLEADLIEAGAFSK